MDLYANATKQERWNLGLVPIHEYHEEFCGCDFGGNS